MENISMSASVVEPSISDETGTHQVRILILNDGQNLESTLFRLEKGWTIEFQVGSSLFGKEICLYTNHPLSDEVEFERNKYYVIEWKQNGDACDSHTFKDDAGYHAQLTVTKPGSFHYYFTEKRNVKILGSGYFTVNPVLKFSCNDGDILLLDSIQCQTVLAKCLGPFSEWEERLRVSKESGYNMIHFTPVQELGKSNSAYCLKDHVKLDPRFSNGSISPTFDDLSKLIEKLQYEWKVLSIGDVVLNHVANESPWLLDYPECTYNMITAPHLIPAAILDGCLFAFSRDVGKGKFSDKGIPVVITSEEDVQAIKFFMETELIPSMNIGEFYTCDPEKLGDKFKDLVAKREPSAEECNVAELKLIYNSFRGRQQATVDMELSLTIFNKNIPNVAVEEERVMLCVQEFKNKLQKLNEEARNRINCHLVAAVNNSIATIRYERLQVDGPRKREISEECPLFPRYFTGKFTDLKSVEKEVLQRGEYIMAHNGWVMNGSSLINFASKDSDVYIRRELVSWGDSVKLRYGDSYEDCPYLWDRMREYIEVTARTFHGIRLDNCHATPFAIAEYLLDCARRVRPDLYIIAELFTNSNDIENIFINRLGITSIIRESIPACSTQELGRLVHRYGGNAIGSFCFPGARPVIPSIAHALFYDITHDNESLIAKKSVFDCLATSAIVNMACCASASTRGFDELVPHHINVVNEERLYTCWSDSDVTHPGIVNADCGIISFKKRMNLLHKRLNDEGYSEIYVDQMNENIIAVSRHNPTTHETVILVAYSVFSHPDDNVEDSPHVKDLKVEGKITEVILEAFIEYVGEGGRFSKPENFVRDKKYINGLDKYEVRMKENIMVKESTMLKSSESESGAFSRYELASFTPGSIIVLKVTPLSSVKSKLDFVTDLSNMLIRRKHTPLVDLASKMSLEDLNYILYRCSEEDAEQGQGSYEVPGYGSLVYCGLQGFSSLLADIRFNNDLGHPFCDNLRQGDWMFDYISSRLKSGARTRELGVWFETVFGNLRLIPRYLIPRYFDLIITSVTNLLISSAAFQMSEFVRGGSTFIRSLAMGTIQCVGCVKSAQLPLMPSLHCSNPSVNEATLCAGLPHFTVGYMRSWGRDTFISLRGLLLITGRYEVARCHILGYAACLRHGLIPNLLGNGVNARFNCRDAVWWWLHSIIAYVKFVPNGWEILNCFVPRIFPKDDSYPVSDGVCQPLHCIMQEVLSLHFQGVEYRERNAGTSIDEHMTDLGFNNRIGVDLNTGFVYGGNEHNCGTWMDKMGSSSAAGNRGRPATPRDGSAVELVGLSKAVIRDLAELNIMGHYPYDSVKRTNENGETMKWTLKEWEEKITLNFDDHFWVDKIAKSNDSPLIHRREIYKDTFGATQPWADYQLRCNFPIALVLAPEMTDPTRAWTAIQQAEKILLGPLGMKTLDPDDWNYCGDYSNDDNSTNPNVAHGFNYHQGPEWIWPAAFFLRAKLHFSKFRGADELRKTIGEIRSYLGGFYNHLMTSHWRGLPELTNANGAYCKDGCHVQAWSMGCILEVLYDMYLLDL